MSEVISQNSLAAFFNKQRELIEAAETPFAKLAIFILPILSPLVPATLTGMHLYQLFLEMFTFPGADRLAIVASIVPSLVLELLGYVGAISFIQSLFKWIEGRADGEADKFLVPAVLNFFAYIFYLAAMFLINVNLGNYFGTPEIVNNVIGLLSFITVPTSLLAANHLALKEHDDKEEKRYQEKREDKKIAKMIKAGMNPNVPKVIYQSDTVSVSEGKKEIPGDWRLLTSEQKRKIRYSMTPKDIMTEFSVSRATAYNWKNDVSKYPV